MPTPDRSLVPKISELSALPPEVAISVIKLANDSDERATKYAIVGMVCGTLSFLGCVADYAYLVMQSHPKAAAVALGTGVLAIIRTMIKSRR
jgi:hypothetical protein